jgi:hypothetical protein
VKPFIIALILGQGTDVTTSLVGFSQGFRERNPLIISTRPAPFIGQVAIVTVGEVWLAKKIAKKHPKLAKALCSIQIGSSAVAAITNIRTIRKHNAKH